MRKEYKINGIDCQNCARKIEDKIGKEPHVDEIRVDIITDTLIINSKDNKKVINQIKKMEPSVIIQNNGEISHDENSNHVLYQVLLTIALLIISSVFQGNMKILLLLIAYIIIAYKVLFKSFNNIKMGNIFDEFFLMSLATIAAILIGDIFEAVMVMLLYMIGEYLQLKATNKSKETIKEMLEFQVKEVEKISGDNISLTLPAHLQKGDIIKIKVGEKIPVDSIVEDTEISLNTSALTGESIPKTFHKNDEVLAGMIVENKSVILKVEKTYDDSTIAKMIKLIKDSSQNKSKTEKFITKFARVYTPIIVLLALCLIIILPIMGVPFDEAVYRAIILLVISCPCALVISVPLGYFMTIGKNTKSGILIKGANSIDALSKMDTLVVDKTGTLTKGNFEVDQINNYSNKEEQELLRIVSLGEKSSTHPIAKSISNYYEEKYTQKIKGIEITELKGLGIKYIYKNQEVLIGNQELLIKNKIIIKKGKIIGTPIYVAIGDEHVMTILVRDQIKDDTVEALNILRKNIIKDIIILTGDTQKVAEEIASEVKVKEFYSELLPEDKVEKFKIIKKEHEHVGFVGDGINDAAVLALADVGIAMGKMGSDIAIESADVIINNDSLMSIYKSIKISKRGLKIIKINIFLAIGVKLLFIILAVFGQANMIEAIFADVGITLLAILNSLRILK